MISVGVGLKNPKIILMPITEEESKKYASLFASVYLLYRCDDSEEIQIGIPDLQSYSFIAANMYGAEYAAEKAYFYCGGSNLAVSADSITDRPIYAIVPTCSRTVAEVEVLNGIDIELNQILSSGYDRVSQNKVNIKEV